MFAMMLLAGNAAYASRQLEKAEILEILKTLTDKSIATWIGCQPVNEKPFRWISLLCDHNPS